MNIVTRFAPSPTGYLHIGGARTALFNYLFAKKNQGKFLLRIEDTDKLRSTKEATDAIINGLQWLNLQWDEEIVYQSDRFARHKQIAKQLVDMGKAYYCYTSQEEINTMREVAKQKNESFIFKSPYRDAPVTNPPKDISPVIRLKTPVLGQTLVNDLLQGEVIFANVTIDDMILLRSDETPTYMLSAVVDDYDMNVTHIIRGDDHLNNAAKQIIIFNAMQWKIPEFIHIPLIYGADGSKLSKRHGALGVFEYRQMGYLPEALNNYLLRLGWSHGNDEIISQNQAIEWFYIKNLNKGAARLDFAKLDNVNAHYINETNDAILTDLIIGEYLKIDNLSNKSHQNICAAMYLIKPRAQTLINLVELAKIFIDELPVNYNSEALELIKKIDLEAKSSLADFVKQIVHFDQQNITLSIKDYAKKLNIKISEVYMPLRALITGQLQSPSIIDVMCILGKDTVINRIETRLSVDR